MRQGVFSGPGLMRRAWHGYALAVLATLGATAVRWAIDPLVRDSAQYLVFYLSVMLVASFAGIRPGLLATALGAAAGTWLFVHLGHVGASWTDDLSRLALFLLFAGIATFLAGRLWEARNQAAARSTELGEVVRQLRLQGAALEAAANGILLTDANGAILWANPAIAAMTGYSVGELIGQNPRLLKSGKQDDVFYRGMWETISRGAVWHGEVINRRKDGTLYTEEMTIAPVPDANGRTSHYVAIKQDVSRRRQVEEALRHALVDSQRFRQAVESVPVYVYMKDLQSRYTYANEPTLELFGCSAEELVGCDDTRFFPPETAKRLREVDSHVFAGEQTSEEIDVADGRSGRRVYLEIKTPIYAEPEGNTICGLLGISTDITERKQAEQALAGAKAAAEEANAAKDHFLAVLSHELRTPLTPVLPALEELLGHVPEAAREDLEMARRNVELEARLIDDLLDVTRISKGKVELHRQTVELSTILRRAAEVCAPDIEARRLHFGMKVEGGPYPVDADPARLQQVFWNLIKNAVKFTPHGGSVGIRCRRESVVRSQLSVAKSQRRAPADDGPLTTDHAIVEVTDSGMGIEPAALARIFNAFEQVDRSITRQFGGLGLGLAISRALVQLHGGTIEAHSEGKDKGATFTVRLPIADLQLPIDKAESVAPHAKSAIGSRKLAILLVEDHGDTARIMRRLLKAKGHEVETAGDVATALELAQERSFDLLISDLGLPDGSGLDIMRELAAQGKAVPAIALSGYGQEQDIVQSHAAGFAAHLTKPVNMEQLVSTIAHVAGGPSLHQGNPSGS